jgi:hypothetical protein
MPPQLPIGQHQFRTNVVHSNQRVQGVCSMLTDNVYAWITVLA